MSPRFSERSCLKKKWGIEQLKKSFNIDHWLPHIHTCTYSTHTFSQTEKYMPSVASKEKAKMANKCMRGKPGSLSERNQQNNKLYQINKVSIGQVGITPSPIKQTAVQTAGVDRAHPRFHLFLSEWSNGCLKCKNWNSGSVTPNMARWHNGYVSWRKQKNSEIKSCLTSLPLCCPKELPVTCLLLKGERWHREPRRSWQMAPADPPPIIITLRWYPLSSQALKLLPSPHQT